MTDFITTSKNEIVEYKSNGEPRKSSRKGGVKGSFLEKISKVAIILGYAVMAIVIMTLWKDITGMKDKLSDNHNDVHISNITVKHELKEIGEFATYSFEYTGTSTIKNKRKIIGLKIPLTSHRIDVTYTGTIKAGIEMCDVDVIVDNKKKEITIMMPEVVILDNYINDEDVVCSQRNNILNPIKSNEVTKCLSKVKEKELETALEEGIKEKARKNAERMIKELLEGFEEEGYTIEFKDKT